LAAVGGDAPMGLRMLIPSELVKVFSTTVEAARATPLANSRPTAIVLNNTMVRLTKRPPLSSGAEEERVFRPPPRYVTKAAYSCAGRMYVRHGTKEAPTDFAEFLFPELG
jgi:hypothetical protein